MDILEKIVVLLYLVSEGQRMIGVLGHTHVQKLVYLLEHARGLPLGYEFKMHHYGPYSEGLRDDLFSLSSSEWGLADVKMILYPSGYAGYSFSVTKAAEEFLNGEEQKKLLERHSQTVAELLRLFKDKQARDVELIGTTHFVWRLLKERKAEASPGKCVSLVKALKPHFSEEEVSQTLQMLQKESLL